MAQEHRTDDVVTSTLHQQSIPIGGGDGSVSSNKIQKKHRGASATTKQRQSDDVASMILQQGSTMGGQPVFPNYVLL